MSRFTKPQSEKTVIITEKAELKEPLSALEPYLIQISGRETGQMYHLVGRTVKIGRDPMAQISLDDPHISRNHAEIIVRESRESNEILLRDVGSTNGVFVNGNKITEHVLHDGDKILIGTRLYFKFCYQDSVEQNYQQNLFRAANIDSLTQLYNKKYFIDVLSKEFSYSKRNRQPLSLMMIDIDRFKSINDSHGHIAGDLVLKTLGAYFMKHIRLENVAARYGGEEFSIILRNVNAELAKTIAERIRKGIEGEEISHRNKAISVTISIGIATLDDEDFQTIEDFIHRADEYLYQAKERGRNRVMLKRAA